MHDNLNINVLDDNPGNSSGVEVSGTTGDASLWHGSGGGFGFFPAYPYGSDIISNHETYWGVGGVAATVFGIGNSSYGVANVEGIALTNNIYSMRNPSTCLIPASCASNTPLIPTAQLAAQ
jgi:hypothetical protein